MLTAFAKRVTRLWITSLVDHLLSMILVLPIIIPAQHSSGETGKPESAWPTAGLELVYLRSKTFQNVAVQEFSFFFTPIREYG